MSCSWPRSRRCPSGAALQASNRRALLLGQSVLSRLDRCALGCQHQGCVDDLTAACDEILLEQLCRDAIEERLHSCFTDPVLEDPPWCDPGCWSRSSGHRRACSSCGRATGTPSVHRTGCRGASRPRFVLSSRSGMAGVW